MKLHDAGLEKKFFTSDDFSMLDYGCGLSRYPQFYYRYLDKYQVLPRPYLGCFEGYPRENTVEEKWVLDLTGQTEKFVWGFFFKDN